MTVQKLLLALGASMGMVLSGANAPKAQPAPLVSRAPDLDDVAGVYKHRFENADVSGRAYPSEDIFELVKLTPKTAYFRVHIEFFNGHECNMAGVADLEREALTYHEPPTYDGHPCVMKFTVNKDGVIMNDVDGFCRSESCGARGSYSFGNRVDFPFKARRRIRYMPLILKSREYASAVKEHDAHPVGTPAPSVP